MRDLYLRWHGAAAILVLIAALLAGCPPTPDDDDTVDPDDPWIAEQHDLAGAALSIWGTSSSDVWVAGTGGDVDEPMLLHRSGDTWEQLDTGEAGEAWWLVGDGEDVLWLVGADGMILRYDRAADEFMRVATDTSATLFGAWIAPSGALYTVGGVVGSADLGPIMFKVEAGIAAEVTDLPTGIANAENFFKVWGAAEDDIWVISDMGTILHFDGVDWGRQVLPAGPRLVTVHGSGADDVTVVGGASRATMFERDGAAWQDVSPAAGQGLNGVYLTSGGGGFAAGVGNYLMERTNGVWTTADGSPIVNSDWHAAWIDETGAPWIVGGNLMGLSGGIVARRENP